MFQEISDQWLNDYETAVQLGREILAKTIERNQLPKGSSDFIKATAYLRRSIQSYSNSLKTLRKSLQTDSNSRQITDLEADRRQRLLNDLITKEKQIDMAFRSEQPSGDRSALLNNSGPFGNVYESHPDDYRDDDPLLDVEEIRQQQRHIIREQDAGLDALSNILGRQRQMALDIGNEVDGQNELLDDISTHVSGTQTRISRATDHVKIVDRKSATCGLWVVIILLAIVIVVVGVVPFH